MGRTWTEEQKKEFGEKMRAKREARKIEREARQNGEEEVMSSLDERIAEEIVLPEHETVETINKESSTDEILKRAIEAIEMLAKMQLNASQTTQVQQAGMNVNAGGKLTGTINKYPINADLYPDPTERLAREPRLKRFGFEENYKLIYTVSTVEYTTIDNVRMREPKFQLDLVHLIHDEDTGELTGGAYTEYRVILHEDPETALIVAKNNGLTVDQDNEQLFLNEMRFIQMRDWLIECFYKPKPNTGNNQRQMVINGKLVDFFEINSKNTAKIPFDQLDNKL